MKLKPFNVAAALIVAVLITHPAAAQDTSPSTLNVNGRAAVSVAPTWR